MLHAARTCFLYLRMNMPNEQLVFIPTDRCGGRRGAPRDVRRIHHVFTSDRKCVLVLTFGRGLGS